MKARDRKKLNTTPIICSKCGASGGTLVRVDVGNQSHYEHQNKGVCQVMQMRRNK